MGTFTLKVVPLYNMLIHQKPITACNISTVLCNINVAHTA